ncbi:MAG TPA: redoxin domain-containing protein [Blastocatellia bacterium]
MRKRVSVLCLCVFSLFIVLGAQSQTQAVSTLTVGAAAPEFELKDLSGQPHSLKNYRGKLTVITFLSARCPISNAYKDRVKALAEDYAKQGVAFLGINASADEPIDEVRAHAEQNNFSFTILKDEGNIVADAYAAERTPKVYVIDAEGVLRYQGRIDSSHNPRLVKRQDLRAALDELLAGKPVSVGSTQAMGCILQREEGTQNLAQSKTAKPAVTKPVATKPAAGKPAAAKSAAKPATAVAAGPKVPLLKPAAFGALIKQSQGKVLVINFWATWCGPCVAEFPELVKIDLAYRDKGVRMVGITADDLEDLKTKVIPFLREQKAEYENFLQDTDDPQQMVDVVMKDWPGVLPATFVYDKTGKLVWHRFGIIDRDALTAEIEKALK